jgi:hypothetical protein
VKIAGFLVGWQGWHSVREEAHLQMASARECTLPPRGPIATTLPHDGQSRMSDGGAWGSGFQSRQRACETRTVHRTSAQRRQGSGAGIWRVGGFELGYLLQCGGGGAGHEAYNVPLDWTTGSSSLLAGVLLRLGRIAGQDFEGSSSSRWQSRHLGVQVVDPVCESHFRGYARIPNPMSFRRYGWPFMS